MHIAAVRGTPNLRPRSPRRRRVLSADSLKYAYLTVVGVFSLGPLLLAWITAFKTAHQVVTDPYGLPAPPTTGNLHSAWTTGSFGQYFINSLIISAGAVIGMVLLASMAGYALARFSFWGRRLVTTLLLLGLTIPLTAVILPLYSIMRNLGLLNSYGSVIIAHIAFGLPFFSLLMRAFFQRLPGEIEDAARVDGCSDMRIYWSIMLPLVRPGLMTVALLEFLWSWNNLLLPLVFLTNNSVRTLPIGMLMLTGRYANDYGMISAGVLIVSAPVIVLFIFFQRKFVEGLARGAVR